VSYATSFFPVSDTGAGGTLLDPEEGEQFEVGVKFQGLNQRLQGYVAYYDLTRQNVTEPDSTNTHYSVQIGEQKTKGFETELSAALTDQWNLTATYSYIPTAETTESKPAVILASELTMCLKMPPLYQPNTSLQMSNWAGILVPVRIIKVSVQHNVGLIMYHYRAIRCMTSVPVMKRKIGAQSSV
jgi:outer membrane receptor for ferric coprogen and ferric-rhodotorulic acid